MENEIDDDFDPNEFDIGSIVLIHIIDAGNHP
jgi:hypothetical protein